MYKFIKPVLFLFPPEKAHSIAMILLRFVFKIGLGSFFVSKVKSSSYQFMGLNFQNRLGMAAGFDKSAIYVDLLEKLGFGSVEIGTITPRPQEGNPKPRLFRIIGSQALINRMGFNNNGLETTINNLRKYKNRKIIIGGNIGKNKDTPNEKATSDYLKCFEELYPYVDYFTINVSSPNTPNLRALQEKDSLIEIITNLQEHRNSEKIYRPICLKIAPDLTESQMKDIVEVYELTGLDALVVSNTTLDYTLLGKDQNIADKIGSGGLSGKPIYEKTNECIKFLKKMNPEIRLIGVGGIDSRARALERIDLGCELIQIYTGFVFKGIDLVADILKAIEKR